MTSADASRPVEQWLRRLRWALAPLPAQDRDDIVAEARAHLQEAIDGGQPALQALSGFGAAEDYARPFVDQRELSDALGSRRFVPMLRLLVRRMHRSLLAALALAVLSLLLLVAVVSGSLLLSEITDPVHTGLWQGGGTFFVGVIDDPHRARDLLGNWLYPAALAGVALPVALGRLVLLWAVRRLAPLTRNPR